jgi:hypothetical protein
MKQKPGATGTPVKRVRNWKMSPGAGGAAAAAREGGLEGARLGCAHGWLSRRHHHQPIDSRFRAPRFTRTAEHLPHGRVLAIRREAFELLRDRIEFDDGVRAPLGQPYLILVVDPHRVRVRLTARQLPFAPRRHRRVVHADLAGVPVTHPDAAARIGPEASRTLRRRRRFDDGGFAGFDIDAGNVIAGE